MNRALRPTLPFLFLAALACDSTAPASAQYAQPAPRQQAPPPRVAVAPPDQEIRQTVARVSLISGNVSFSRGDDPDTWGPADLNVPMTLGDRAWTGDDGQLELQVHGGSLVRLAARTDLQALNLTTDVKQFSLVLGTASFSVRRLDDNDVFEVDTPNAAITFERPGDYRVDVNQNGDSRVQVRRGRAVASAGGGQVTLAAGQELDIDGIDAPRYEVVALPPTDGWDRWVEARDQRFAQTRSYAYVTADIAGVEDLDQYGRWQQIPDYGWAWSPTSVEVGWTPYRTGRWIWQDPWGWTWVAAEPWGWAPYHYGRWAYYGAGWYWVPVAPTVHAVAYSPALVAFVGGSAGYVGWFPLAPRDPYYPWWRRGPTSVTQVTYVNRTYVTVVNQTVFVSGRSVSRDVVHDRTIIRSVESAPVLRGPVPVVPTRASIRMTTREGSAARPSAPAASRQVVTRTAPPPPPPSFDTKLAVIREKGGAPVAPADAARLLSSDAARAAQRSRPAVPASGTVTLAPKNGSPSLAPGHPQPSAPPPPRPSPQSPQRPTAVSRPPDRPTPSRPTPHPVATPRPERAPAERVQAPPVVHERPQPAERIAPEPRKDSQQTRPTPKRTPTKTPKKDEERKGP